MDSNNEEIIVDLREVTIDGLKRELIREKKIKDEAELRYRKVVDHLKALDKKVRAQKKVIKRLRGTNGK